MEIILNYRKLSESYQEQLPHRKDFLETKFRVKGALT